MTEFMCIHLWRRDVNGPRLLRTRPSFSQSVIVNVAVSVLGFTAVHFLEPDVKINSDYYRNTDAAIGDWTCIWRLVHFPTGQRTSPSRLCYCGAAGEINARFYLTAIMASVVDPWAEFFLPQYSGNIFFSAEIRLAIFSGWSLALRIFGWYLAELNVKMLKYLSVEHC